jgi:O-antigen ligase
LLWAKDVREGSVELAAFLFPFLALVAVVVHEPGRAWLPRALAVVLVSEAVAFAAFGLWEESAHRVFFSRSLEVSNIYTSYFRTNSLFYDPNIYGRHLALALSVLVVLMWQRRRLLVLVAALIAFIFAGLYYSYSQSSLFALFVVVVGITLVVAGRRTRQAIAICAAVLALAGLGLAVVGFQGHSVRNLTSGRSHLASITFDVFRNHPLVGVGVGSQPLAAQKKAVSSKSAKKDVSHTTPLTVAAELGVLGLAAYLAWLAGACITLWKAWKRDATIGLSLAAVFGVLFVHSLSYSGFFEDPITWGALALAAACLPRAAPVPAPAE